MWLSCCLVAYIEGLQYHSRWSVVAPTVVCCSLENRVEKVPRHFAGGLKKKTTYFVLESRGCSTTGSANQE